MKIGIFDSGLGGLVIAKEVYKRLPNYSYIYLGDTKHLPYGNKSKQEVLKYTRDAVDFLFKQDCQLIIIACNTASALALRKLQQEYLPKNYPNRKVLGVIVPTMENVAKNAKIKRLGVLATSFTVKSHVYKTELKKLKPSIQVFEQAAPKLVPLIEKGETQSIETLIRSYVKPLTDKKVDAIALGCTHFPLVEKQVKKIVGSKVLVINQSQIIPERLADYLKRHRELNKLLPKKKTKEFFVTKLTTQFKKTSKSLFGTNIKFKVVKY